MASGATARAAGSKRAHQGVLVLTSVQASRASGGRGTSVDQLGVPFLVMRLPRSGNTLTTTRLKSLERG